MKPLLPIFLLAPTLAFCGAYSGTVSLLDGTPVTGAVIKNGSQSVTTSPNGAWTVASVTGIASRSGRTIASTSLSASPVTPHLTLENGRPRLSFAGFDISGRPVANAAVRNVIPQVAARSAAGSDTLIVYWKGKRLTVMPVPADTGNITFKIDTAWKDDAGIPWNPRIPYGSLLDSRDGQTYRTVVVGKQTWMAENLNFASDSSHAYKDSAAYAAVYGRLYSWATAMTLPQACDSIACPAFAPTPIRGVCPTGWHLPSDTSWDSLALAAGGRATAGPVLKSRTGWYSYESGPGYGNDSLGFRGLASGYFSDRFLEAEFVAAWWTSDEGSKSVATGQTLNSMETSMGHSIERKTGKSAVRCLKDTP